MNATDQDICDLVATTVSHIHGREAAEDIYVSGDNIVIGGKPIAISKIKACSNNAAAFVRLIKEVS